MAIEIINRQRKRRVNSKRWREMAERALKAIGENRDHEATIVLVSDSTLKKLNHQFRGRNYATDVLSFPVQRERFEQELKTSLGEVVISLDRAAVQAQENGLTFANEVEQLILHGLLHLCGYDHEIDNGEMNRLELRLRRKLGI
jgi:probable rRNA maturation factor